MFRFRREFLKKAAAAAALASLSSQAGADTQFGGFRRRGLARLFDDLPGDLGWKIHVPSRRGKPGFTLGENTDKLLFVASAIKTFALCEALRQADSPDIVEALETKALPLDASVWSPGSPIFNPPALSGIVSERTALEAMILRSDNTATDMIFNLAGADNIRSFIASAGLHQTRVPDSTRTFAGYIFGAENYQTITWEELLSLAGSELAHPLLNEEQTLASTAEDFVKYYSRALRGGFFQHDETLTEFRRILSLCDFIYLIPVPLGVSAYAKSGNADLPGFHARSFAGGMFVAERWVFFAFILNWHAPEGADPQTVRAFFEAINEALTRVRDALS